MKQEKKKLKLKIIIPIVIAIIVILGIVILKGNESTPTNEGEKNAEILKIGDTYISDDGNWEITLTDMYYAKMYSGQALRGTINEDNEFLTVCDYNENDDDLISIYYPPRYGSTDPVSFFYTIKYLGKNKVTLTHSQILLDYNDGYIVDSDIEDDAFGKKKSEAFFNSLVWKRLADGEYKIALDPLKESPCEVGIRQYVYVPKEIMEDTTEKSLKVTIRCVTEDMQQINAEFNLR